MRSHMPAEPSVTSASVEPSECTFRYPSLLLAKSFARPGPKSVKPARNCSGVAVVFSVKCIVGITRSSGQAVLPTISMHGLARCGRLRKRGIRPISSSRENNLHTVISGHARRRRSVWVGVVQADGIELLGQDNG